MTKLITPSFTSSLAPTLYRFVEYKRDSGFKYNSEIKELQRLDRFILNNGLSIPFTDDVIVKWLSKRENESAKTFSTRNSVYRQLHAYLSTIENVLLPAPVPTKDRTMKGGFTPFIFSHSQIASFFEAIDNDIHTNPVFSRNAPLLFRILYGTGLRINEALSLTVADVSPGCLMLLIRDGKNNNSRLVPLSGSLAKRMDSYLIENPYGDDEPLFQTSNGTAISKNTAYDWFRRALWKAGIPHQGRGKGPRLHDLRHTFAVHSLQNAVKNGTDINAFLPILCTYLGHQRISATERYLRLTAEVFPDVISSVDAVMNEIIPEVQYEE